MITLTATCESIQHATRRGSKDGQYYEEKVQNVQFRLDQATRESEVAVPIGGRLTLYNVPGDPFMTRMSYAVALGCVVTVPPAPVGLPSDDAADDDIE